jgi:hypothetical protein
MRPLNRAHTVTLTRRARLPPPTARSTLVSSPSVPSARRQRRAIPPSGNGLCVDVRIRRDVVGGIRQVVGGKEPATPTGLRLARGQAGRVDERHACDRTTPRAPALTRSATGAWAQPCPDHRQEGEGAPPRRREQRPGRRRRCCLGRHAGISSPYYRTACHTCIGSEAAALRCSAFSLAAASRRAGGNGRTGPWDRRGNEPPPAEALVDMR